mmetsp:Transcript_24961/g.70054  ORF Transcript_24961/g.70054 Transcript_24961/m.70054 type:complete len:86 (+) Transcript_24961:303-560(+)
MGRAASTISSRNACLSSIHATIDRRASPSLPSPKKVSKSGRKSSLSSSMVFMRGIQNLLRRDHRETTDELMIVMDDVEDVIDDAN